MSNGVSTSAVEINTPHVASREVDGERMLLHVPSDLLVALDDRGRAIWDRIERGESDVTQLINQHRESNGLTSEVATFQVLTFLDELRGQGFVRFELPRERESAPLIDIPLQQLAPAGRSRTPTSGDREIVFLGSPRPSMTIGEVSRLSGRPGGVGDAAKVRRAILLDADPSTLTLGDVQNVVSVPDPQNPRIRVLGTIDNPRDEAVLSDLRAAAAGAPQAVARRIIIVIVTDDTIIVIVLEPIGPSRGKSRSACKTMCV